MDYLGICRRAIGTLQRRGVCAFIERDELIGEGCLALSTAKPATEALAVTIARRTMIDAIRKNEVRERGRVEVRPRRGLDGNGDEVCEGDQWDAVVHGKQNLRPENTHTDLWVAMSALPPQEFRAITLSFWGGRTLTEIGCELGVSFQRVSQIIHSAKKNIQSALENAKPRTITNTREEISGNPPTYRGQTDMLYTIAAMARYLGVSEKMARKIAEDLPAVRVGKRNRYPASVVEAFAKTATLAPNASSHCQPSAV